MTISGLDSFTSKLAIGAIVIAAAAAAVQAFVDVRPFFNWVVSSKVWEVFIALPVVVLSYLIGLVVVRISAGAFDAWRGDSPKRRVSRMLIVSKSGSSMLANYLDKLILEEEILQGACPATLLLGIGLSLKVMMSSSDIGGNLSHGRLIFGVVAVILFALATVLLFFANSTHRSIVELSEQIARAARVQSDVRD
ncbi:hypothetical protein QTH97_33705 [Variovorax sp. J22R24]|uniref:hypothetical protein n=1 Tax=Variovorax gracilis TaxID=3053502 RepID=UPI00257511E8|nr:hypothetical protein [Variovorax sp. J22R24]MDM0109908.1 hypothetical protein [Variovorax sp. J22R24]